MDLHIKVAAVTSRWQRMGDFIGSRFEPAPEDDQMYYHLCHLAGCVALQCLHLLDALLGKKLKNRTFFLRNLL